MLSDMIDAYGRSAYFSDEDLDDDEEADKEDPLYHAKLNSEASSALTSLNSAFPQQMSALTGALQEKDTQALQKIFSQTSQ